MSLISLGRNLVIYPANFSNLRIVSTVGAFGTTQTVLDAADEAVCVTMIAPKQGDIDRIKFRTGTVTTGATLNAAIEQVGVGDMPAFTKTLWATNTEIGVVVADTDDNLWKEGILTANASVTKGQHFAVVIRQPASAAGNLQIRGTLSSDQLAIEDCGITESSSAALGAPPTAFALTTDRSCIIVRYTDGTWVSGVIARIWTNSDTLTFNSGSATTRAGNRFKLPVPATFEGASMAVGNMVAGSAGNVVLRDDAWGVLSSGAWNGDHARSATNDGWFPVLCPEYSLVANTWYRLTVEPGNTNNITLHGVDFEHVDVQSAMIDANFYKTLYTSGAGDDTATLKMLGVFPMLSAFDDGVNMGGRVTTPITGGQIRY